MIQFKNIVYNAWPSTVIYNEYTGENDILALVKKNEQTLKDQGYIIISRTLRVLNSIDKEFCPGFDYVFYIDGKTVEASTEVRQLTITYPLTKNMEE